MIYLIMLIYEDTQDVNTIPQDFLNNLPHNNLVYQVITGVTRYNKDNLSEHGITWCP